MRTTAPRVEVGHSDMGTVFVLSFGGSPDAAGSFGAEKYEVRAGGHTVATKATYDEAMAAALTLCNAPPAEASEPGDAVGSASAGDLSALNMADLRKLMDGKGLAYNARTRKAELIDHLRRAASLE